ncbi:unnamed protein product [Linum trigynum]|uniref:Uncharacterized protein n=1 Tax=Linum trigynum TaxID=586398 RepID=A0AAV2CFW1_9ROSI
MHCRSPLPIRAPPPSSNPVAEPSKEKPESSCAVEEEGFELFVPPISSSSLPSPPRRRRLTKICRRSSWPLAEVNREEAAFFRASCRSNLCDRDWGF